MKIMMDANQGMDVPSALKLAEQAKKIGIHWFEEPVMHTDFAGYELLRSKCGIALAMGEREYDCEALKHLIARNALDLWQPDIVRLGGVEEWLNSAKLAEVTNFQCCLIIIKITMFRCYVRFVILMVQNLLTGLMELLTIL